MHVMYTSMIVKTLPFCFEVTTNHTEYMPLQCAHVPESAISLAALVWRPGNPDFKFIINTMLHSLEVLAHHMPLFYKI